MKRTHSLHRKLTRVLSISIFSILALLLIVMVTSSREQLDFVVSKHSNDVGSFVSMAVATALWDLNLKSLQDIFKPMLAKGDILGVSIADEQGKIVFEAGSIALSKWAVATSHPIFYSRNGRRETIGHLRMTLSTKDMEVIFKRNLISILLMLTVIAIVIPFLTRHFLLRVTKPIVSISSAMHEYASGNRTATVPKVYSKDEIGDLANAFTAMISELEASQRNLEDKVAERTAQLREASRQVQVASAAKSQFLAVVSHELRTPINGINSLSQLIRLSPLEDTQLKDMFGIETCARSLLLMVDEILDFTRLEEGNAKLIVEPFFLPGLLRKVGERAESLAEQKEQVLIVHLDEHLPEIVLGDCLRIEQLLLHLLRNAAKFSAKGSGMILFARATKDGSNSHLLHLAVVDTGKGISPEKLARIFEPFHHEQDASKREGGGIGIGLSICRRLVSLMNGEIWVKSREQIGSAFHCTIPIAEPLIETVQDNLATAIPTTVNDETSNYTV